MQLQFDPRLKELLVRNGADPESETVPGRAGEQEVAVVVRLHNPKLPVAGLTTIASMGNIHTGRILLKDIVHVRQHANVASLKSTSLFSGELLDSVEDIGVHHRFNHPDQYTGKGSIVGIIDWGADFAHPAFLNAEGKTRLRCIWDQRGPQTQHSPSPYNYGRVIEREDINAALNQQDPYATLQFDPAEIDKEGVGTHGTHVMSIAAGRAYQTGVPSGVAPDAELIFVHLRGDDTRPEDSLGDSVRVLEAVHFISQRAGDQPFVLNMSLGRTGDAKDGTSPVEQALDAVVTERPNRAICMSTGNYFDSQLHASVTVPASGASLLRWQLPMVNRRSAAELEIWYSGQQRLLVQLINPQGRQEMSIPLGESRIKRRSRQRRHLEITGYHREQDPNNGDNQINFFLHPLASPGTWTVKLINSGQKYIPIHAWIERESTREQSRFHVADADPNVTIGTICCGHHTIATAAYRLQQNQPRIAPFSSAGPTRDFRMVPIVTAPGESILAAKSTTLDSMSFRQTGGFVSKSGTSMAAPHVAGTIALMYQAAKRPLAIGEIREALILTARAPPYPEQQLRYGAGLLNAKAAVRYVETHFNQTQSLPQFDPCQEETTMISEDTHNPEIEQVVDAKTLLQNPELFTEYDYVSESEAEQLDNESFVGKNELAEDRPTLSSAAQLTFTNLQTVNGGDGRPHVYIVTTGDATHQRATFRLRIRNTRSVYNMQNTRLKMRYSTMRVNRIWHTVPLAGQQQGRDYLVVRSENIEDQTSLTKSIQIAASQLQQAYDSNYPLARLEIEFHWREGVTDAYYYARTSVTFYLVNPVEFMFRSGRRLPDIVTNTAAQRNFWLPVWEKTYTASDRSNVQVQSTITTSLSRTRSLGINYSYRTAETRGSSSTLSTNTEQTSSGSMSIGIDNIVELGVSQERSMSVGTSTTVSRSLTHEIASSLSRTDTFSAAINRALQITQTITPAPAGSRRVLYGYPVFRNWRVDLIQFTGTNSDGMATGRRRIRNFPVLVLSHWGSFSQVIRSRGTGRGSKRRRSGGEQWIDEQFEPWLPGEVVVDEFASGEIIDDESDLADFEEEWLLQDAQEGEASELREDDLTTGEFIEGDLDQAELGETDWGEAGANRKLRADEVKYLVLEGGGGKGLVYLGAIRALESTNTSNGHPIYHIRNNRLQNIRGVSGSSAGAITALAMSMGMTSAELERISDPQYKDFEEFFDLPAMPRQIPTVGRNCRPATGASMLNSYLFNPLQSAIQEGLEAIIPDAAESIVNPRDLSRQLVSRLRNGLHGRAIQGIDRADGLQNKLLSPAMLYYAQNLWQDLGLFSGCEARQFLDRLIRQRGGSSNMNFADHRRHFGVKLVVTGSNVETGRTMIFSPDTTPALPVADAVRMSMGLPGLFKPVRISAAQARAIVRGARHAPRPANAFEGLYVDGGLWNNLPIPVFAADEGRSPATLGLALGNTAGQRQRVQNVGDYLGALIGNYSSDDVLANKYPSYRQQIVALDSGDIGTADFNPDRTELRRLQDQARARVRQYFR